MLNRIIGQPGTVSTAWFHNRHVSRCRSGGLGTFVSASRWSRKRSETASETEVGGMELSSQKPMNRLSPFFIRLGKVVRSRNHSASGRLGCRGAACTIAARKFERKLLQVLGVKWYLAGRT